MVSKKTQSEYEQIVTDSERLFNSLDKSTQKEYAALLKEVRQEVADTYAKYADDNGILTYAEMQKYNRLKNLRNAIQDIVNKHMGNVKTQTVSTLKNNIRDSYSSSAQIISNAAGVELAQKISADRITEILQKPVQGWTFSERMSLRTQDLAVRLEGAVINGYVHEGTLKDSAAAIKDTAEKDFIRFRSFAGDFNHSVSQDGSDDAIVAASDSGITVTKTWVTSGDDKVREAHKLLDGQTVPGDGYFVIPSGPWKGYRADAPGGFGEPALDYNCRCWIVADVVKD